MLLDVKYVLLLQEFRNTNWNVLTYCRAVESLFIS